MGYFDKLVEESCPWRSILPNEIMKSTIAPFSEKFELDEYSKKASEQSEGRGQ